MAEKMMKVRELVISYGKDYLEVEEKTMRSPLDVANAFFPICDLLPDEHGFVLMLNAKNKMLGYEKFSHGNLTSALVHSRNVFRKAYTPLSKETYRGKRELSIANERCGGLRKTSTEVSPERKIWLCQPGETICLILLKLLTL